MIRTALLCMSVLCMGMIFLVAVRLRQVDALDYQIRACASVAASPEAYRNCMDNIR